MAQINLGRVAYVNKGTYNGTTVYTKYDVVLYNNGSYVYWNGTDASGHLPTDTNYWRVMLDPTLLNQATDNANGATTAKAFQPRTGSAAKAEAAPVYRNGPVEFCGCGLCARQRDPHAQYRSLWQ